MQSLGGTPPKGLNRAASMSGNREGSSSIDLSPIKLIKAGKTTNAASSASNFTVTKAGLYTVVAWGGGGVTSGGGAALAIRNVRLSTGQIVPFTVANSGGSANGNASTVTFPDGVMSAGGGIDTGGAGGTASGGDINVNGSASVGVVGGVAGSSGVFTGGGPEGVPGGGGSNGSFSVPGPGLVQFIFIGA